MKTRIKCHSDGWYEPQVKNGLFWGSWGDDLYGPMIFDQVEEAHDFLIDYLCNSGTRKTKYINIT